MKNGVRKAHDNPHLPSFLTLIGLDPFSLNILSYLTREHKIKFHVIRCVRVMIWQGVTLCTVEERKMSKKKSVAREEMSY